MQYSAIPCNTMQYSAIPCNTMQYHASLITADGAYHCPVGSIRPFFYPSNFYLLLGIGNGKITEMQHRMELMAFAFNWKVSSSWNAKKGELWSWIRNIKLEFQTCSKMFSKSDRKDGNWSRCCQRLRTLALCWHRTKHTGCLKKTEFYRNEHLQIFPQIS